MSAGDPARLSVAFFRQAKDRVPVPRRLTLELLASRLTAECPPVREDLALRIHKAFTTIDAVWADVQAGRPNTHNWAKAIRKAFDEAKAKTGSESEAWAAAKARYEALRHAAAQAVKSLLPAWSPTLYAPDTTRASVNVVALSGITLEFDDGTPIDEVLEPWRAWALLAHTSWSHTTEHPKVRVFLPVPEPIPVAHWSRVWHWAWKRNGGHSDKVCKDPSRIYFLPAIQCPTSPYVAIRHLDRPWLELDWAALPDPNPPAPPTRPLEPVTLPRGQAERVARQRLRSDPTTRARAGDHLGGTETGPPGNLRVDGVRCPNCNRKTVWWWIAPTRQTRAYCRHRKSCGWSGDLYELLVSRGGAP